VPFFTCETEKGMEVVVVGAAIVVEVLAAAVVVVEPLAAALVVVELAAASLGVLQAPRSRPVARTARITVPEVRRSALRS
jgi:hypothetical protein